VFELVLEHPGAVDAAIGVAQAIEETGMSLGAVSGMHAEQPSQAFYCLAPAGIESPPLVLAHLVHRLVQCLDDMEAVDDEGGIGAMMLDRLGIGATHVTTGPQDACFLPIAQGFVEEVIDGLAALSPAYPQNPRAIQVIDNGGKLSALQERDLVDTEGDQATDFMPVAHPRDDPVQQVGQGRGRHFEDSGGGLLGHDLAQGAESPLQAVGDA